MLDTLSMATSEDPTDVVNIDTISMARGKNENMAKKLIEALRVRQLSAANFRMLSFSTPPIALSLLI
jgi:hypothetical protein